MLPAGLVVLRNLYLLIFISVMCHTVATGNRVAATLFAIELGASTMMVGLISGLYGMLPMLLAVSAGRLSDRIGARMPMICGSALMSLGVGIPYFAPQIPALLVATTLTGCGFMLYNIALQNVAGSFGRPEDRALNFNLLSLGFSVSGLLGPLLVGIIIDNLGHRYAFLLMAILPLIPLTVLGLSVLELPRPAPNAHAGARKRVLDLLGDRRLVWLFLLTSLLSAGWEVFTFLIPVYGTSIGLSATAIGVVMAAFSFALLLIRVILPAMIKRIDSWLMITATLMYGGVLFCLFPLMHSALGLTVLSFFLGLGLGCPQPLVISLIHKYAPSGRVGEAIGLRQALMYSTQSFMPVLMGALAAVTGMAAVFWLFALVLAGGGFAGRRLRDQPSAGR